MMKYTPVQGRGFVRPGETGKQQNWSFSGIKKAAPKWSRLSEQLTCCEKIGSVQGNYINRVTKRHNCRITGKTKATGDGRQWGLRQIKLERITNNATFAAGGQCDQCAGLLVGYSCSLASSCCDVFQVCDPIFVRLYSLRNFSRWKVLTLFCSASCSAVWLNSRAICRAKRFFRFRMVYPLLLTLRCSSSYRGLNFADTLVNVNIPDFSLRILRCSLIKSSKRKCLISLCFAVRIRFSADDGFLFSDIAHPLMILRQSSSHYGAGGFYSDSLALRRWRRLISPRMAVTINCASVSFSSFTKFISLKTSRGTLAVFCCDLLLVVPVGISVLLTVRWCSVYGEKKIKKDLKCKSPKSNLDFKVTCTKKATPALLEQ